MQKIIEIEEGRSMNFKASAFSPIAYNRLFPGQDFLRDMQSLQESHDKEKQKEKTFTMEDYEHFVRIAYTFAYQGMAPTPRESQEQRDFREQYPNAWDWIDSFDTFSIYEILPEIVKLWASNEKKISQGKNGIPAPPER